MRLRIHAVVLAPALFLGIASDSHAPAKQLVAEAQQITEDATHLKLSRSKGTFRFTDLSAPRPAVVLTASREYPTPDCPDEAVVAAFKDAGWTYDPEYAADGPDGTAFAYRKKDVLCVFEISWSPGHVDYESPQEEAEAMRHREPNVCTITVYVLAE